MRELLRGENLTKIFTSGILIRNRKIAVDGVNISLFEGEALSIVGESGSGKTTLIKLLIKMIKPTYGKVYFMSEDLEGNIAFLSQHPEKAFDPRWKVYQSITEPLKVKGIRQKNKEELLQQILERANLNKDILERYPQEVSGGELQKIALLRAIISKPKLLACDEPTSMLDASSQASILNLLLDLKSKNRLTLIFVTHDLEIAKVISDRVAVMINGEIVEIGQEVLQNPLHPYTKLLSSQWIKIDKTSQNQQKGCKFSLACPERKSICLLIRPPYIQVNGRVVKCWLYI